MIRQLVHQDLTQSQKNKLAIYLLGLRYLIIYFPLFWWGNGFEENTEKYDNYTIAQYTGRAFFLAVSVFCISFLTDNKQLKGLIKFRFYCCESYEVIKLIFVMFGIENYFFHTTYTWEWILGIGINLTSILYFAIKYKRNEKNIINNNI